MKVPRNVGFHSVQATQTHLMQTICPVIWMYTEIMKLQKSYFFVGWRLKKSFTAPETILKGSPSFKNWSPSITKDGAALDQQNKAKKTTIRLRSTIPKATAMIFVFNL